MQIKLNDQLVEYQLTKSFRTTGLRISIDRFGKIKVSAPKLIPQILIDQFLISKANWILHHLSKINPTTNLKSDAELKREFIRNKPVARQIAKQRLEYFNQFYGYKYTQITIRNQSSRWGSCTSNGHLSFNYRIALIPPELADLVIVHELCHLKEMNHSHRFWALVRKSIPDYLTRRNQLNKIDLNISED